MGARHAMARERLPWGWQPVTAACRTLQREFWSRARNELLAVARVSLDELGRWREKAWISFDAGQYEVLDTGQFQEIVFISNLARSGLSDEQIDQLLGELERPYRYDPVRTAYSFGLGWVQMPPMPEEDEVDTFFREYMPKWIRDKALDDEIDLLRELVRKIIDAIAEVRGVDHKNSEDV